MTLTVSVVLADQYMASRPPEASGTVTPLARMSPIGKLIVEVLGWVPLVSEAIENLRVSCGKPLDTGPHQPQITRSREILETLAGSDPTTRCALRHVATSPRPHEWRRGQ